MGGVMSDGEDPPPYPSLLESIEVRITRKVSFGDSKVLTKKEKSFSFFLLLCKNSFHV